MKTAYQKHSLKKNKQNTGGKYLLIHTLDKKNLYSEYIKN